MTAVWVAVLVLLVAVAYVGMWLGWRNRAKRQSDIPEPEWFEDGWLATDEPVSGTYVSTTMAGRWLDRVTAHGLGSISEVTLASHDDGLLVVREGAPTFRIAGEALLGTRRERGIAGKVRDKDGLMVITWRLGMYELDTGIRPARKADMQRIEQIVAELMEGVHHG